MIELEGELLVTSPKTAFFTFIGSGPVGWYLNSKASAGTRSALEHGGVAPVIVEPDADVEAMIPDLVKVDSTMLVKFVFLFKEFLYMNH